MNAHHLLEVELLQRINESEDRATLVVSAAKGHRFGVLILHHGRPVGLWSYFNGKFRFRGLASWDFIHAANGLEHAIAMTLSMATSNKWQARPFNAIIYANRNQAICISPNCFHIL